MRGSQRARRLLWPAARRRPFQTKQRCGGGVRIAPPCVRGSFRTALALQKSDFVNSSNLLIKAACCGVRDDCAQLEDRQARSERLRRAGDSCAKFPRICKLPGEETLHQRRPVGENRHGRPIRHREKAARSVGAYRIFGKRICRGGRRFLRAAARQSAAASCRVLACRAIFSAFPAGDECLSLPIGRTRRQYPDRC